MKQLSYLAIMTICLVLFTCVLTTQSEFSFESHQQKKSKKVSCGAVTLAVASCKKGDIKCITTKAKKIHKECPQIAESAKKTAKKAKIARKAAEKVSQKVNKIKQTKGVS